MLIETVIPTQNQKKKPDLPGSDKLVPIHVDLPAERSFVIDEQTLKHWRNEDRVMREGNDSSYELSFPERRGGLPRS